jgi:hypothetical protein
VGGERENAKLEENKKVIFAIRTVNLWHHKRNALAALV